MFRQITDQIITYFYLTRPLSSSFLLFRGLCIHPFQLMDYRVLIVSICQSLRRTCCILGDLCNFTDKSCEQLWLHALDFLLCSYVLFYFQWNCVRNDGLVPLVGWCYKFLQHKQLIYHELQGERKALINWYFGNKLSPINIGTICDLPEHSPCFSSKI